MIRRLTDHPHRFELFQALRLLQQWLPSTQRGDWVPSEVRFRNSVSLTFPASEIESLRVSMEAGEPDGEPARVHRVELTPLMMGLLGVTGTLPVGYTEQIARHERSRRDDAARAFLDVFSHRAVAMFYGAWKKSRLHLQYEQDRNRHFVPMILALGGLGPSALRQRLAPERGGVHDESLAYFAATLQRRVVSASQLTQVLSAYLTVPVRVEQFAGRWYPLPAQAQTSLGRHNGILGQTALVGQRIWQRDLRVRLFLGPLDPERFRRFLPGTSGCLALKKLLGLLCGSSLEFEVNLVLQAKAVRGATLVSQRPSTLCRLGWDTYLLTNDCVQDRSDVRYDINPAAHGSY